MTKAYEEMLKPLTCEIICTYERNFNVVFEKTYEEENDDTFMIHSKLDAVSINEGKKECNGCH